MARSIVCKNKNGQSITFGTGGFSPFLLVDCEGIYSVENNVVTSDNTMTDGATYQGSTVKKRNIVLTVSYKEDYMRSRNKLYSLFTPKSPGTFVYMEDGEEREIEYYVEKIENDSAKRCRTATISLICPDPYFVAPEDIEVALANWEPQFTFAFSIPTSGIEFGTKANEKMKTIENDSAADRIGLEIVIEAIGEVLNPKIYHIEKNEFVRIGTDLTPFKMQMGDRVIITTGTNNKHIYLESDESLEEINGYLDLDSEFLQLVPGNNTFAYTADSGEGYMTVTIKYRFKYLGV